MRFRQVVRTGTVLLGMVGAFAGCGGGGGEESSCNEADCVTPPGPSCDGNRVVRFSPIGACAGGECVYTPSFTDCAAQGGTCESGACVIPPDPCEGVVCNEPPATACDGDLLLRYAATGTCDGGDCGYEVTQTDCAASNQICEDARCKTPADLCFGILCETPPDDTCEGEVAIEYSAEGACDEATGECAYAEAERTDCAATGRFCLNGRCQVDNPCAGITCNAPPAPFCNEEGQLVVYAPRGTCAGGECTYTPGARDCDEGEVCDGGSCREVQPCDGVVCNRPFGPSCRGTVRNFYEPLGVCTDGLCNYTLRAQDCALDGDLCVDGACVPPDACTDVVCDDIPATTCRGNTVVAYRAGTCADGTCTYPEVTLDCTTTDQVCVDGACETVDLCAGVSCLEPPLPECFAGAAVEYFAPGTCVPETGECEYEFTQEVCTDLPGFECIDAACVLVDLCADVLCEAPAAFCEGDVAVSYIDGGVCVEGECDTTASEVREDCTETGSTCVDGGCVGPGASLSAGDVVLSEIFVSSDGRDPEVYIELYNSIPDTVNLGGLVLRLTQGESVLSWEIPLGTTIDAFGHVLLGNESSTREDLDARWPFALEFVPVTDARIELVANEGPIHGVTISASLGFAPGTALAFDPGTSLGNLENPAAWCPSLRSAGAGVFGTPRTANDACPARFAGSFFAVTELMPNGNPLPFGQETWFEIYHDGPEAQNLQGLTLQVGSLSYLVDRPYFVDVATHFVFARETSNLPNRQNAAFPGLVLNPTGSRIAIFAGDAELATLFYDASFPFAVGRSATVQPGPYTGDLNDVSRWCGSADTYGPIVSQFGSPSAAATSCD